jgi:NTE family protein
MSYKNLVFCGGGTLGIAHIGVIKLLTEKKLINKFVRFAGSSVGSIIAAGMACGATYEYLHNIFDKLNLETLKDDSWLIPVDAYRLITNYGICKGDALYEWVGTIMCDLMEDPDVTFDDVWKLRQVELIITGTDLDEGTTIYFNKDLTPNMPIRTAVRISTSYPYFYQRVVGKNKHTLIDGGCLNNYPINVFDMESINYETLGSKLISTGDNGYPKRLIGDDNILEYTNALIEIIYQQAQRLYVKKSDWKRTIPIHVGNRPNLHFNMSTKDKLELEKLGYDAALKFLSNNQVSILSDLCNHADCQTNCQTDIQMNIQTDRQMNIPTNGQINSQMDLQMNSQMDLQMKGQMDLQTKGQMDLQMKGQMDSQTNGQININLKGHLDSALDSALAESLETNLENPLEGTLDSALEGFLDNPLEGTLDSALEGFLDSALENPLEGTLEGTLENPLDGNQLEGLLDNKLEG